MSPHTPRTRRTSMLLTVAIAAAVAPTVAAWLPAPPQARDGTPPVSAPMPTSAPGGATISR